MTTRVAHSPETAEYDLRALVREIGPGFHPDTRGADYANLPPRWEIRRDRIDETVQAAIDHGLDPYAIALDVLGDRVDTWSSASRQHYIDTGRYLLPGEAFTDEEPLS